MLIPSIPGMKPRQDNVQRETTELQKRAIAMVSRLADEIFKTSGFPVPHSLIAQKIGDMSDEQITNVLNNAEKAIGFVRYGVQPTINSPEAG